ncbi:hypothetical protein Ancab_016690 [Ancistrocladus abbreviatus]
MHRLSSKSEHDGTGKVGIGKSSTPGGVSSVVAVFVLLLSILSRTGALRQELWLDRGYIFKTMKDLSWQFSLHLLRKSNFRRYKMRKGPFCIHILDFIGIQNHAHSLED